MLLAHFLKTVIHIGKLNVIDAKGRRHLSGSAPGPEVTVRLHNKKLHYKLLCNPDLHVGEAYMDGTLTIEKGSLEDLAEILMRNLPTALNYPAYSAYNKMCLLNRRWQHYNPIGRAQKNVAHHYDLPDDLYDLFLDRDRQYSCAYFTNPDEDLETAQRNKQIHLAAKLRINSDHRVLDIGSGWGGLALYLAQQRGAQVKGLTLSKEQFAYSCRKTQESKKSDQVKFALRDYREETGKYDRIVSVGMFEHVGIRHYEEFFDKIKDLLTDDGVFLLHSIGRMAGPSTTSSWIRKYIFPGGYSPALSEVMTSIERAGLWIADIEILRLHYAETLRLWSERFKANRREVAELLDVRFCRMWEYYLAISEAAFRYGDHMVFQIQITKHRDALPLTRDYISQDEQGISPKNIADSGDHRHALLHSARHSEIEIQEQANVQ